jgi:hypothetical protein
MDIIDFFEAHGWFFLAGVTFFPRITLLLSSVVSGGLLWWLGWIFTPHLLVAFLSLPYWDTNPFMVCVAWIIALTGTKYESDIVIHRKRKKYYGSIGRR